MNVCRILHVEDEPDIRDVVQLSLALDPQIKVKSYSSAEEALAAAADWRPHGILTDVVMPMMDGPQLLQRLRGRACTAQIPVIFMTARAQTDELEHLLSLGAAGVISKPFDPITLAADVRACLPVPQSGT